MRCPECQQRNSVAARKCKFCGARFKRKEMPPGKKIALFVCSGVLAGSIYLGFALPKMVDPSEQLMSAAKRIAGGAKSSEDAKTYKAAFDEAVKNLLLKFGSDNSGMLSKRLKACLPATTAGTAFEVLVVDLPKGLKLVEIDTVLQATDFLIMKGTNDTRVIPLPCFEVYDDARAVNDQAGAVIVLVGHSSGQPPHKPLVQTLALLPDSVVDESATMVPSIAGEGTAKFSKDSSDINVELTLPSVAQSEKISMTPPLTQDKILRTKLQWKVEKYVPTTEFPQDLPSSMLLVARSLKHPELAGAVTAALGSEGGKLVKEHASTDLQDLSVRKSEDKHKSTIYTIASAKKKIDLELKKVGPGWQLAAFTVTALAAPATKIAESNPGDKGGAKTGTGHGTATAGTSTAANTGTSTAATGTSTAATGTSMATAGTSTGASATSTTATGTSTATAGTNTGTPGGKRNDSGETKSASTKIPAGTEQNTSSGKKPADGDLLGGLTPERAGSHVDKHPIASTKTTGSKSSWLDDEQAKHDEQKGDHKTPLAVLPTGLKNSAAEKAKAEKEKAEKAKKEKDKKEKEKADKEKADAEKAEKEKAEKAKKSTEQGTTATIAGNLGTSSVRLRSGPGLSNNTLDEIPKGTKIQIIGQKKGWYKVSYGGKVGYVFSPLVDTKGAAAVTAPAKTHETAATKEDKAPESSPKKDKSELESHAPPATTSSGVVVHVMTVRDEHRRAISSVKVGEHVVVLSGLKNNRYKIRKPDGTVGYVAKEALDVKVETPPEFVP